MSWNQTYIVEPAIMSLGAVATFTSFRFSDLSQSI